MMKFDKEGKRKKVNSHTATKFTGDMVKVFLEHMSMGGTIVEFCRNQRIARSTFDKWVEKYPHMRAAKAMGKTWAEGWWLTQARLNLITETEKHEDYTVTKKFDTSLYKYYMSGRFGHMADKNAMERLEKLEGILLQQAMCKTSPGLTYAEEAECDE
jgi:hypothetical protein